MINRIRDVRQLLKKKYLDAFIVFSNLNIRYLTGFEGSAGILVVSKDKAYLFVDGRYTLKARKETMGIIIVTIKNYFESLMGFFSKKNFYAGGHKVKAGFEEDHLSYRDFRKLIIMLPDIRLHPCAGFIERLRECKDREEINFIKKAIAITEKALVEVAHIVKPGITEKEIADRLEDGLRRNGARWSGFRTIAAIPENAGSPHSEPGESKIPRRGLVLVDAGCDFNGYNSDLTRMFLIGRMTQFERKVLNILIEAQKKAIQAIRPGKLAKEIDAAARAVIERRGFGKYFSHGLGHGVGLAVHEEPSISRNSSAVLKEGMIVTVEPGIYLPNRMGVRVEDMVLVTKNGRVKLTNLPPVLKL